MSKSQLTYKFIGAVISRFLIGATYTAGALAVLHFFGPPR